MQFKVVFGKCSDETVRDRVSNMSLYIVLSLGKKIAAVHRYNVVQNRVKYEIRVSHKHLYNGQTSDSFSFIFFELSKLKFERAYR